MSLLIDNPLRLKVAQNVRTVLIALFAGYKRIIIQDTFKEGYSGSQVLKIKAIRSDSVGELPTVVKIASISQIEREWLAYQKHIHNRLYYVAYLTAEPVKISEIGLGGLRYALMGGGRFETTTLLDYLSSDEVQIKDAIKVVDYLMRSMYDLWFDSHILSSFRFRTTYDRLLPVHYRIDFDDDIAGQPTMITPDNMLTAALKLGQSVEVSGFQVHKVNLDSQTVTLRSTTAVDTNFHPLIRFHFTDTSLIQSFTLGQTITSLTGWIDKTRFSRLFDEVQSALGQAVEINKPLIELVDWGLKLPNPLYVYPNILNDHGPIKRSSIHGDLNFGNILVEPERNLISIIDFSEAATDHILHDFLSLEREVITQILPQLFAATSSTSVLPLLGYLFHELHIQADLTGLTPPSSLPSALHKCWAILSQIRQEMRYYLYTVEEPREYYKGLFLYLLGALKFKNLNDEESLHVPKQLAFWGAVLAYQYATQPDYACQLTGQKLTHLFLNGQIDVKPNGRESGNRKAISTDRPHKLAQMPIYRLAPVSPVLPHGSRMPWGRNPAFIGRETELKSMARVFKQTVQPTVLNVTGMGGLGKTQLVTEFIYRYGRYFSGVFWLSIANPTAVLSEIAACGQARFLDLQLDNDHITIEKQAEAVLDYWAQNPENLLIFDNCEDASLLEQWLPLVQNSYVLVTSRGRLLEHIQTLSLDPLPREESIFLLRKYYQDEGDEILEQVAAELGHLPLALHIAGSYLRQHRDDVSPMEYLRRLREQPFADDLLRNRFEAPRTAKSSEQSIQHTFMLSYQRLDPEKSRSDQQALFLLECAACLALGESIPHSLLVELHFALMQHGRGTPQPIDAALSRLAELGFLLNTPAVKDSIRLHRLVLDFVQHVAGQIEERRQRIEQFITRRLADLNAKGAIKDIQSWQAHIRAVAGVAQAAGREQGIDLGHHFSEYLKDAGDYQGSKRYIVRSVSICEGFHGLDAPMTAFCLAQLGHICGHLSQWEEAQANLERALAIQEHAAMIHHPHTAVTLNFLGFLLQNKRDLDGAWAYHTRALQIRKRALGLNHTDTGESLINLGYIHFVRGFLSQDIVQREANFTKARENLQAAIDIYQRGFGPTHKKTISAGQYLGELAFAWGDMATAQDIYRQVLRIWRKIYPSEHPEIARILALTGLLHIKKNNFWRAEICLQNALRIRKLTLGANSLLVGETHDHLGELAVAQRKVDQAIDHFQEALTNYQLNLEVDDPKIQAVQIKLGNHPSAHINKPT